MTDDEVARLRRIVEAQGAALLHWRREYDKAREEGVAAEREACAQIAESEGVHPTLNVFAGGPDWYKHAKRIAAAIRARGAEGAQRAIDAEREGRRQWNAFEGYAAASGKPPEGV